MSFIFQSLKDVGSRVLRAIKILHAFTNSATPLNPNSTRCMMQIQTTYGNTGKASGAIIWAYQIEKWRISSRDKLAFHNNNNRTNDFGRGKGTPDKCLSIMRA